MITAALREVLAHRRRALGMSQADLADLIGCGRPHVCGLERGTQRPSFDRLSRWADALAYDVEIKLSDRLGRQP